MSTVKRVFYWLSGAGTDTLERCPNWEQRKYVAFGATVLVPCACAFIACAYALSTLTENPAVVYPVAAVWAFIILSIDRALLAGYRAYLPWTRKISQFALRFVVALLMGVTIAHPLVLLLFRDAVRVVIEKDRAVEIEAARAGFTGNKAQVRGEIERLEEAIAGQREKWNESFQAKFIVQEAGVAEPVVAGMTAEQQLEVRQAIEEATAPFRERLGVVERQIGTVEPESMKMQAELGFWQSEFERELNGQRSGLAGEGPRARSIRTDQLEPRREESRRLAAQLEHLTGEKSSLQTQVREAEAGAIAAFEKRLAEKELAKKAESDRVAGLRRSVEGDQAKAFVTQQNALRETIKVQIDARLEELKRVQDELAALTQEESSRLAMLRDEPRRDILTQSLALHKLFQAGAQGGTFALCTYGILTVLFMLVDTIPLIIKFFTKAGPYDTLVDRDEVRFDAEHRSFRESHGRYMRDLAEGNLLAVTRNQSLENALIDGVEHSRAAREFLHSLIEMEKAFAEKMELEESLAGGPDKLVMLQAIKARFYQDVHERMEAFFASASSPSRA